VICIISKKGGMDRNVKKENVAVFEVWWWEEER
jgi:hypothetical protein